MEGRFLTEKWFPANKLRICPETISSKTRFLNLSHVKVGGLLTPRIPPASQHSSTIANTSAFKYILHRASAEERYCKSEEKKMLPQGGKIALPRVASHLFAYFWLQC